MAVNSSILSALLRLVFMLAFASLLFSVTADALELTRNGKSYGFDVELPDNIWRSFYAERGNEGIPEGLLP